MDPVSTVLITVATLAGKTVLGKVVGDGYERFVAMIKRKFGAKADPVIEAGAQLQANPESKGYPLVLQETVAAAGLDKDAELLGEAEALLKLIRAQPGGERHAQIAIGNFIAQADGSSTAQVIVNTDKEDTN